MFKNITGPLQNAIKSPDDEEVIAQPNPMLVFSEPPI